MARASAWAAIVLTNSATRVSDIPTGLDSVLLEDRTPLVVKGMQVVPSATNRFKKQRQRDHVHGDLRTAADVRQAAETWVLRYHMHRPRHQQGIAFHRSGTGGRFHSERQSASFPAGMLVKVKDLPPGSYRLVVQAVDGANNHAPNRTVDFDVTD